MKSPTVLAVSAALCLVPSVGEARPAKTPRNAAEAVTKSLSGALAAPAASRQRSGRNRKLRRAPVVAAPPVSEPKPDVGETGLENKASEKAAGASAVPLPLRKPAELAKPEPPPAWTLEEVATARARCSELLANLEAVTIPAEPIKEGACGTAAPIRLVSVGSAPQIAFSPPALMNCELAANLTRWLAIDVQPAAKRYLDAEVIKVEVMSDYACRNAANRKGAKMSEHGLANALDIRGFMTDTGLAAYVLEDWGETARDAVVRIAEAKAKEQAATAKQIAAKAAEQAASPNPEKSVEGSPAELLAPPALPLPKSTIIDGLSNERGGARGDRRRASLAKLPEALGGVPAKSIASALAKIDPKSVTLEASARTPKALFLRQVHAAACKIFGTTLGPEANNDHLNHFHVDMAFRRHTNICD